MAATYNTAAALAALRARSRTVHVLRLVLPLIIAAIGVTMAFMIGAHAVKQVAAAPKESATQIRMVNPHFYGRDKEGRAFMLGARQAQRDDADMRQVFLDGPEVTMDTEGQHPTRITADRGVYREDTRILRLTGNVRVDDGQASSAATNEAIVDTRTGQITGGSALAGSTSIGSVQAGQYGVYDKGDRLIFRGRVHARLKGD